MLSIKKVVFISILIITQLSLKAQNNTNSPYTRFGYGELADRSFGAGRAMGGVGIGLRSSKQINPMNPASYSCMDSLTFLFDFGVAGQVSWFYDGVNDRKNLNGNVEYIALQFPITRWLAVSAGILPYSHVGYKFGQAYTEVDAPYVESFVGSGSVSDAYVGVAVDVWKKRLSVGVNMGYLFGTLSHERNLMFSSSSTSAYSVSYYKQLQVHDLKMDFGVQYTHPLDRDASLTIGATYSPGQQLSAKSYNVSVVGSDYQTDTIQGQVSEIPHAFGLGASYMKNNKLTLAADVQYEKWKGGKYFDSEEEFKNRVKVAAGIEFIPNYMKKLYFNRIRYRAGVHYSNSYLNVNVKDGNSYQRHGYNEYGASIGFGFPLIDNRSLLNLSFEYVKVRPEIKSMIDEQYFRFALNYTFNELWFFKRKVD